MIPITAKFIFTTPTRYSSTEWAIWKKADNGNYVMIDRADHDVILHPSGQPTSFIETHWNGPRYEADTLEELICKIVEKVL